MDNDRDCCEHDEASADGARREAGPPPAAGTDRGDTGTARPVFRVYGLDCAEEVAILEREVGPLVGGKDYLAFDVLNGRMTLLDGAAPVPAERIRAAVARTGMTAESRQAGRAESGGDERRRRVQALFTIVSGIALFAGVALHAGLGGGPAALFGDGHAGAPGAAVAAYLVAIGAGGRFVLPKAWLAARRLRPDMHLLMTVAVIGAIGIGEWFEAGAVAFLFALSLALEGWSTGRAQRAIAALLDLAPPTARVRCDDGTETEVPAADVPVGSLVVVRPGERLPLDARVVRGSGDIDQSPITGESLPVTRQAGDTVFAGTINGDSVLEVETTKAAGDTTLARIIRMVEEAHRRRAPAEQWVEHFARVYTPTVMIAAVLISVLPPLALGGAWDEWFYRSLVLLVIACPCALVISTPVSIVCALAAAARRGVLVKGGLFIEQPASVNAIAFDKTGTLTLGQPRVVGVTAFGDHDDGQLLERAAALEAHSTHPIARAITEHAAERGVEAAAAVGVTMLPGRGVQGTFEGETFWLGSHRHAVERGEDGDELRRAAEAEHRAGRSVIIIGSQRHVCGLIAVADTLRPHARSVIDALRADGVRHLVMLTGDNCTTADAIARESGIDEVHAELLPEDKVRAVDRLVERHGRVAMVGDGVNDAPAMARASFGVAMGAAGSDAAIETADIALMTDDLERLPWLRDHSRRTLRVIRGNIAFALGIKALFVLLTLAGLASLWGAIAADVGASLLVTVNALRLLRGGVPAPATHDPAEPATTAA